MKHIVIRVVYFTENGKALFKRLRDIFKDVVFEERPSDVTLDSWIAECFKYHLPIIFISATGIAVRQIAPFVSNKLVDSAVIVIDELGQGVIPILSGHFGGANEIAYDIAKKLNANAVITTATDINNKFAIDVFARKNGFKISDKNGIKNVSRLLLDGKRLKLRDDVGTIFSGNMPDEIELTVDDAKAVISDKENDIFTLIPKRLVLGIGCKRDKDIDSLLSFVLEYYDKEYLRDNLYAIATIDIKDREIGIIKLAQYFGAKLLLYSAKELEGISGDFPESDFVKASVQVSNVCERAACKGAGLYTRKLLIEKQARDGMTLAAAKREIITADWEM